MSRTDYFYKYLGLIFSNTGKHTKGKRDVLFRSSLFAMARRDYRLLFNCYTLIKQRRRWPKIMDSLASERTISPFRMTRDPYWAFWAASYLMNKPHYIEATKPPSYTRTPSFMAWRRYLITREEKYKRRYEFWSRVSNFLSFGKEPAFSVFLDCLAAWVVDSYKLQGKLHKRIPEWNLCCRQLTLHPDWEKDGPKIEAYRPQEGFLWQSEVYYDNRLLPEDQEYYMDKELLDFVWDTNRNDFLMV